MGTPPSILPTSVSSISSLTYAAIETPRPVRIEIVPSRVALGILSDFSPFWSHDHVDQRDSPAFESLIQNAIHGRNGLYWLIDGCRVDGRSDCPRICEDRGLLFGSPENFYNCVALASLSYWTQHTRRFYIPREMDGAMSTIMGSTSLASFDRRSVLQSFVTCAQDACGADGLHKPCDDSVRKLSLDASDRAIFEAMDKFCLDLEAEINPDIFGPGVLISYVLQVSFSAFLYLLTKGFTLWVRFSQKARQRQQIKRSSTLNLTRRLTRIESIIWRDSSALSRTSIAIATTLVEFQEAQAWFVFAIQIASILAVVVNSQEGTFWGEITVNASVAFQLSQNGILPMFLMQLCLHHEGIRNWHTFLGFVLEHILAIVAATQKLYLFDAFRMFKHQNKVDACGGNPSPRSYCASVKREEGLQPGFFPHPWVYGIVFMLLNSCAMFILILDQLSWTLKTHQLTKHVRVRGWQSVRLLAGRTRLRLAWIHFKSWVWSVLEMIYLVVNLLYLVSLVMIINADSFEATRWSYGQIIAMTVWGPVILKLFNLVISGPPKNGPKLNSGPPRLRIDNVINRRQGTSADEELEAEEEANGTGSRRRVPVPPQLDLRARSRPSRSAETDLEDGFGDDASDRVKADG